jgi:hypothetical protein
VPRVRGGGRGGAARVVSGNAHRRCRCEGATAPAPCRRPLSHTHSQGLSNPAHPPTTHTKLLPPFSLPPRSAGSRHPAGGDPRHPRGGAAARAGAGAAHHPHHAAAAHARHRREQPGLCLPRLPHGWGRVRGPGGVGRGWEGPVRVPWAAGSTTISLGALGSPCAGLSSAVSAGNHMPRAALLPCTRLAQQGLIPALLPPVPHPHRRDGHAR